VTGFDDGLTLADRMRRHAGDRAHLYAELMRSMADDWETGGPVRAICQGWESSAAGTVVQLRLLAGLFRIVLTGRAPQLEKFYPCLGGGASPSDAWPLVRDVLAAHVDELHEALEIAPQTNEVGRSGALLVGLFEAVRRSRLRRIRLLEPGASAGLNLLIDEFRFVQSDWSIGPPGSPLVLTDIFEGTVMPEQFTIVQRRGCDLSPVDASTPDGQLRLTSFVWPFHLARHQRLACAFEIARRHPVTVDAAAAGEWLEHQLNEPQDDDTLTVVWHSITRMYWPPAEATRVEAAVGDAVGRLPLARVAMEYVTGAAKGPDVTLVGLDEAGRPSLDEVRLARAGDHGVPVTMQRPAS
jgi:hypothetical protein